MSPFAVGVLLGIGFVTPLVLVYFAFLRWCDRFEPEPLWLLVVAFVWGAFFATLFGGMSNSAGEGAVGVAFGIDPRHPIVQAIGATVFAPVFEEGFKAVGVFLVAGISALGLKEFDGALDGAIYGGVVGLGFTMTEDILYVASQFAHGGFGEFLNLWFVRTVLLGLSHCTFTACTGLAVGMAAERGLVAKVVLPPLGLAAAMGMHAMHNGLPTFFGSGGLFVMLFVSWLIDLAFFALLALLVIRDRATVIRELSSELGSLLKPAELALVASYTKLGSRNLKVFFERGFRAYRGRRKKQLALVDLAFVKMRRRRGEASAGLDAKEQRLRGAIADLNAGGVVLD